MNTFDPTKHPRGNQTTGHAGQFATKQQTSAEVGLAPAPSQTAALDGIITALSDSDLYYSYTREGAGGVEVAYTPCGPEGLPMRFPETTVTPTDEGYWIQTFDIGPDGLYSAEQTVGTLTEVVEHVQAVSDRI